ncbi:MAG: ribonuclease III domain-containing protein [Clostridia bacterium]
MEKNVNFNLSSYSPLVLAYMGDAYYETLVRKFIIANGDCKTSELNKIAKNYVTAVNQSKAVEKILPFLDENEEIIYKSGRNAKSNHSAKSADVLDYRRATGLETLFGYFYLSDNHDRATELFNIIAAEEHSNDGSN